MSFGRWQEGLHVEQEATELHDERIAAVQRLLVASAARSILDLGCGRGALLVRLAGMDQFQRIAALDVSPDAILAVEALRGNALPGGEDRVAIFQASFMEPDRRFENFDAAVMLETIEHVDPGKLSRVENAVFGCFRPKAVLITTPNCEYNPIYGIPDGAFRHEDHRFEWSRAKFKGWSSGVARRNGYRVAFAEIGTIDPLLGAPTQMAVFSRCTEIHARLKSAVDRAC
jgi:small RNA 2'-O-methyltransferase